MHDHPHFLTLGTCQCNCPICWSNADKTCICPDCKWIDPKHRETYHGPTEVPAHEQG